MSLMICSCLPGVLIFYYLYHKETRDYKSLISRCICYALIVNLFMIALNAMLGSNMTIVELIRESDFYALIYTLMATLLIWVVYVVCEKPRNQIVIRFNFEKLSCNKNVITGSFYIIITMLFIVQLLCVGDCTYNVDEIYTIQIVQLDVQEMIEKTANDVHPPLYYLILKFFCEMCDYNNIVFHFVSLLPVLLGFIFSATKIRKSFGMGPALVFAIFLGMSTQALRYNMEVRMYSLASFFVLLAFWELRNVLVDNKIGSYIKYVCFSLVAAYTHYYALVTVAFLYMVMFLYMFTDRKRIIKTIIACITTVLAYLPWLSKMSWRKAQQDVETANFEMPNAKQTIDFLYSGLFNSKTILIVIVLLIVAICYESNFFKVEKADGKTHINIGSSNLKITIDIVWIFAGVLSGLGLYCVGKVLTDLIKPMFTEKYLYNYIMIAWLLIVIALSKLKTKNVYCGILICYMLISFIPGLYSNRIKNVTDSKSIDKTMEAVSGEISDVDVIITNIRHIRLGVGKYYFPGAKYKMIDDYDFSTIDSEKSYLIILSGEVNYKIALKLKESNMELEMLVKDGHLGEYDINIYKIIIK